MNKQSPKILVVDSNKSTHKDLKKILLENGFETLFSYKGSSALNRIKKNHIALALISLNLVDMSEIDVLRSIKEISPDTECIMLVESSSVKKAEKNKYRSAYSFIHKPLDSEQLILTIQHALEKKITKQALSFAETHYEHFFNNSQDGIVLVSMDGKIIDANASFIQMVGYSLQELNDLTFWDLTPEKWYEEEKTIIQKQITVRGYSDVYEKEYICKNGSIIPIEVHAYLTKENFGKTEKMWAFVRNISERKKVESDLRRQLQEVTVLQNLTAAGTEAETVDELLHSATKILGESLYKNNFGIFLYDEAEGLLNRHYSYRTNVLHDDHKNLGLPIDKGIIGKSALSRIPQRIADVSKNSDYFEGYSNTKSELAFPIIVNNKVFGVINTESSIIDFYTEDDEKILISLANQLATSITKIQLDSSEKQQAKEISVLYDTAITTSSIMDTESLYRKIYNQVKGLFPLDTFLLVEYDSQDETIRIAFVMEDGKPLKEWQGTRFDNTESGLIGWVIKQRQPYLISDLLSETLPVKAPSSEKPARSWLGVPLITKGKVVGGLSVQAFAPNVFNNNHQRLLESLAAQLASAVDNAQLTEKNQHQIDRLEALHDIDLVINSSLDLRVTLNILLDQVIEKLEVDAAAALLVNSKSNLLEYAASRGFRTRSIENYKLQMGEGLSGKTAIERHLVKALNLDESDGNLAYTNLMQEEGFVSYYSVPLIAKGQVKGVLDIFNRTILNPDQDWFNFLETLGGQAAIAIDNTRLLEDLHQTNIDLRLAYDTTLEGWSRALDLRDKETEGHTQRVVEMTQRIANVLGVPDEELIHMRRGALLHDIGKMGIPDSILLKPGPLSDEEWDIMRQHPVYAYQLLYPISHLRPAIDIPYCHHERWDGTGYPRMIKGDEIPIASRIFSVVDVWDALTSDRPYRKAWTSKKALNYIQEQSAKHFEPKIVDIFLKLIKSDLINHHD